MLRKVAVLLLGILGFVLMVKMLDRMRWNTVANTVVFVPIAVHHWGVTSIMAGGRLVEAYRLQMQLSGWRQTVVNLYTLFCGAWGVITLAALFLRAHNIES